MSTLMTHLVAGYPNRGQFVEAVGAMVGADVAYLEIQLPFTNPLADGPVIYVANQVALKEKLTLPEIVALVAEVRQHYPQAKTELLLMTYLTPIYTLGLANVVRLLADHGFAGLIVPDLPYGSVEHAELVQLAETAGLTVVPVISPLTTATRLATIKKSLRPGQLVYATARVGTTGSATNLADAKLREYLTFLKKEVGDYQLAVGFGIKEKAQVAFLNQQDMVAVVGSEIVTRINQAVEKRQVVEEMVGQFLQSLT